MRHAAFGQGFAFIFTAPTAAAYAEQSDYGYDYCYKDFETTLEFALFLFHYYNVVIFLFVLYSCLLRLCLKLPTMPAALGNKDWG